MTKYMKLTSLSQQGGNTIIGIVIGLIIGLCIALGVAYVITKNPPIEKANVRPPDFGLNPKASSSTDGEVPDVNQPLRSKNRISDLPDNDPVAAIVKSKEDTSPAIVPAEPPKAEAIYWVQLGAYGDKSSADSQKAEIALQGIQTRVIEGKNEGQPIWRLRMGPFKTETELQASKTALDTIGVPYSVIKAN